MPLWRLGDLKGKDGLLYLREALATLKPLAEADRLDAKRKGWIASIDAQIKTLEGRAGEPSPLEKALKAVQVAFEAGDYAKAAEISNAVAEEVEKAETEQASKPGGQTVSALGNASWYALFARRFEAALAATDRALGLAPDQPWIATNRAHAFGPVLFAA